MPPAAFQIRNFHQGMWLIPASHAVVTRSKATKRPMKTVFAPCLVKKRSAGGSTRSKRRLVNDQRFRSLRPPKRPSP